MMFAVTHDVLSVEAWGAISLAITSLAGIIRLLIVQRHTKVAIDQIHTNTNSSMSANLQAHLIALRSVLGLRKEIRDINAGAGLPNEVTNMRIKETEAEIKSLLSILEKRGDRIPDDETPLPPKT